MPTTDVNLIRAAIHLVGRSQLARACACTRQAIVKWERAERLPRTELTGETDYAARIAHATNNKIKAKALLQWTRTNWTRNRGVV